MPLYLGLDCGGSSSRAMLLDSQGRIAFVGKSGPANIATTPRPYLAMSLKRALEGCSKPDYVCGCFAGLVSEEYKQILGRMLEGFLPGAKIEIYPDYYAVFSAALDPKGCCVISGTGSMVCSKVGKELKKSGGGGLLIGDEGSAFSIGRSALKTYIQSSSEEISDTLQEAIIEIFGVEQPGEILAKVYRDLNPAARIALLAQSIAKDWDREYPYAKEIVAYEMEALAKVVTRHLKRYHQEDMQKTIYIAGGLWEISPIFQEVFTEYCQKLYPFYQGKTQKIAKLPVYGAALLAKDMNHEY